MEKQEIRDYAQEVAKILGENDEQPISQIEQLVELLGRDFVQEQLEETQKIEEKGGLKTDDNKRRRTMGGTFFYIVKGKMDESVRQKIFPNFGKTPKAKSLTWEDRQDYVDNLMDEADHGVMRHVMITLQGRPGKMIIEGKNVPLLNKFGKIRSYGYNNAMYSSRIDRMIVQETLDEVSFFILLKNAVCSSSEPKMKIS